MARATLNQITRLYQSLTSAHRNRRGWHTGNCYFVFMYSTLCFFFGVKISLSVPPSLAVVVACNGGALFSPFLPEKGRRMHVWVMNHLRGVLGFLCDGALQRPPGEQMVSIRDWNQLFRARTDRESGNYSWAALLARFVDKFDRDPIGWENCTFKSFLLRTSDLNSKLREDGFLRLWSGIRKVPSLIRTSTLIYQLEAASNLKCNQCR